MTQDGRNRHSFPLTRRQQQDATGAVRVAEVGTPEVQHLHHAAPAPARDHKLEATGEKESQVLGEKLPKDLQATIRHKADRHRAEWRRGQERLDLLTDSVTRRLTAVTTCHKSDFLPCFKEWANC